MEAQMEAREYQLAAKSLQKRDKRQAAAFGKGATTGSVALSGLHLPRLTEYLAEKWKTPCRSNAPEYNLERMLRQLAPELVALVCIQTGLHVVSQHVKRQVKAFKIFADNLEAECFHAGLFKGNKKLAERSTQYAAKTHAAGKMRRSTARAVAEKAGFMADQWADEERVIAGVWCSNLLTEGLPDVFRWEEFTEWNKALGCPEKFRVLTVAEEAHAYMRDAVKDMILRRPVWLPRLTPPEPWTSFKSKPSADTRVLTQVSLLKSYNNDQIAAVKKAIADGTMAPTLKGINTLQAVPFQINSWLLGVMDAVQERGITVPGFTVGDRVDLPPQLTNDQWNAMSPEEKKQASTERTAAKAINRQRNSDITLLALDMEEAHRLAEEPEFYLPMTLDSRGRVYALPRFNFARGDHVRSLFLLRNGLPMTEKGTYWLQVHVANCWALKGPDGIGLDKKPMDERVQWVKENLSQITAHVADPLGTSATSAVSFVKADNPWLFLAACRELVCATTHGSADYVCHLPVSFDASCSGLQHMSAATRAAEGAMVNLTNDEPKDIYSIVADVARRMIEEDARGQDEKKRHYAQLFLSYKNGEGIDRKLLKRNCMTFCYSSTGPGMGDQQFEDLMVPLQTAAVRNKTPHHFGTVKEQAAAARYMGRVAYAAITEVVKKPAEGMDFLKLLAGAMAHEGKPVRWTTPAGLPCVNRYHEATTKKLKLWLHNESIYVYVATGKEPPLLKKKCQQAISPNFVHSLDAAHLLLVAGACADEGIEIVTVHDSFGCLPVHADRMNQILREQFVLMYQEHDVLTVSRTTAKADLTEANHGRLPPLPDKGALELSEVLQAKYAFA
jgi:DNA-directed RNA polymerase